MQGGRSKWGDQVGSLGARKGVKRGGLERRDWKMGEARRTWGARMRLAWFEGRGQQFLREADLGLKDPGVGIQEQSGVKRGTVSLGGQ